MKAKFRKTVHPKYKGIAKWQVEQVASLPQLIEYSDPVQGKVSYDPRILLLESPECGNKVLWFNYWIATSKTSARMRYGGGPPMLEESVLLELLKNAIKQSFFTKDFLKELARELNEALSK